MYLLVGRATGDLSTPYPVVVRGYITIILVGTGKFHPIVREAYGGESCYG